MMRTALQFSGGKDSLALLFYMRALWPFITVVHLDTGDAYTATRQRVMALAKVIPNFVLLRSDSIAYRKANGPPGGATWISCCRANIFVPMHEYLFANGYRQVLRGTKACDPHVHMTFPGDVMDGILFTYPLWHCPDGAVCLSLGEHLPAPYRKGATGMPHCKSCEAVEACGNTKHLWDERDEQQAALDLR